MSWNMGNEAAQSSQLAISLTLSTRLCCRRRGRRSGHRPEQTLAFLVGASLALKLFERLAIHSWNETAPQRTDADVVSKRRYTALTEAANIFAFEADAERESAFSRKGDTQKNHHVHVVTDELFPVMQLKERDRSTAPGPWLNVTLEKRSIDRAYVLKDLYRDASNPSEVVELEWKLAEIEQHATRIFEDIHNSVPKGKLTLARSDLDEFRKYLFLVYFRRQVLGLYYYDKDRPEDTPMDKIDAIGAAWMGEQFMDSLLDNFGIDCEFAIDYFPAINFELRNQAYFVGFWEAAETDEFVLTPGRSGVGFGRYRERACSTLLGLPVSPPDIDFAKAGHDVVVDGEVAFTFRTMDDYNPAIRRKRDRFTMKIHKLTPEQTFAVNAATLRSTRPDGALSFTSRSMVSSAVDRILEVAVLVRFLDLIVKSPQLVAAFRIRCASLFRWMHLCPHPTRNPKDCLDYPYDADWPPVHRDIRK
uniref:Uncharacterized protein n=1 Tax=Schizophyllum commune (strain H4-8 / FGSC 9210) TaxID=578458 RepID=D8PT99_SCHCM